MLKADINNEILLWAVNRRGLSIDILKKELPKIEKWINKEDIPTIKQIEKLANILYVPFGIFFTQNLPKEETSLPFFRTEGDQKQLSLELLDTINLIKQRQEWVKEYFLKMEHSPIDFVGTINEKENIQETANKIRKRLGLEKNWAASFSSWQKAFNYFISVVEKAGVFVFINGIVGNNTHRKLDVHEFRGFVINDKYAPFVFINGQDAKAAQIFTLAHELVHVWIGKSAIFDLRELIPADDLTEKFCNYVAAELLVPKEEIIRIWDIFKNYEDRYQRLAKHFKVSEIVIARKALDEKLINKEQFFKFYKDYLSKKRNKSEGANFYLIQLNRVGRKFGHVVHSAVREGSLLYREAYKLTGLYGKSYEKFMKKFFL